MANIKTCIICNKPFNSPQSNNVSCCSKKCSSIYRALLQSTGANFKIMLVAKEKYFVEHQGENHPNAKCWEIESPSGKRYKCINLMHFIKDNPNLFDGTPKQVFDGFAKIKATKQGKRKFPSHSYKGWKLISWQ